MQSESQRGWRGPVGRGVAAMSLMVAVLGGAPHAEAQAESSPPTSAATEKDAAKLYKAAQTAFAANRLEEAKALLEQAYAIRPNPGVLAVLGQVEFELGSFARAAGHLTESLLTMEHPVPIKRKLEEMLNRATERVATIVVDVSPPDASVSVDATDGAPGTAVVRGSQLFVEPGVHELRVEKAGFLLHTQRLETRAGGAYPVTVTLEPSPPPPPVHVVKLTPPPTPAPPAPDPPPPSKRVPTVVALSGGGLTAALLGTGLAFHLSGRSSARDAEQLAERVGDCSGESSADCERLDDLLAERNSDYRTAKILYGVSAGTALLTTVLTVVLWPREKSSVAVWITPHMVGLSGELR